MVFSLQKEANFTKALKLYVDKHGYNTLTGTDKPKNKKAILPDTVELEDVKDADTEEYLKNVEKALKKHKTLYSKFKDVPHVEALIYRYHLYGFLNNSSLSVDPKLKKKWGINYELFGAFYNTNTSYNSLFPVLEPGSQGNVHFFKPKKDQIILANPPYTENWIRWTIRKILDEWKDKATFYVVIPVWDNPTRKEIGLREYSRDFPDITEIISQAKEHSIVDLPFYDGITQKLINLKDPVHVILI